MPLATPTCSCPERCRCSGNSSGSEHFGTFDRAHSVYGSSTSAFDSNLVSRNRLRSSRNLHGAAATPLAAGNTPSPLFAPATPLPGAAWNLREMRALQAWQALGWPQTPLENHKVYVALIDTGIDTSHPDLQGRLAPWSRNSASSQDNSDAAHGTAMAGIIAATGDNGVGIDGVMWGAQLIPCAIGGASTGKAEEAVQCLDWLAGLIDQEHIRIAAVNFSFGSDCCDCAAERAIARLRDRGVLVVASSGNGRQDNDSEQDCPFYPASYPLSNILSVTGSDKFGNVLYRYGKRRVHVAAPGVDIPVLTPGGGRSVMPGGSSPAAAHVTGLVALLAAQDPTRSWAALRNLVLAGGAPVACGDQPTCALVSGRRVRAWGENGEGSLRCVGRRVVRRLLPVRDVVSLWPDETLVVRVLSIDCAYALAVPPATVRQTAPSSSTAGELVFRDDGLPPDEVAADGEFAGSWKVPPPAHRRYEVVVAGEVLRVDVP